MTTPPALLLGLAVLTAQFDQRRQEILAPPPTLSVSEWADEFRTVPSYSAEAGRWVTARTPYLREIMDSFSTRGVERVVFKKCARIGATEAGLNVVGYFIHQDPSTIMIVKPTADDAKDFSKEQLAPTIEDTPVLRARVSNAVKDSKNTITAKVYPGGSCVLGGANSPRFFRGRTVRVIILEEVDGYGGSVSAKGEGDQMKLAERRADTWKSMKKVYINSTPTRKGESRIGREFDKSDQRYYHVPCPHCGARQRLVWEQVVYTDRETPAYQCLHCAALIDEADKDTMLAAGVWVATHPHRTTRGYHISAIYSPFVSWSRLVEEWKDAQGDAEALQVFVNTVLGEEWEDRETKDLQESVASRAKQYEPDGARWRVPKMGCVLVCGVDKQHNELHYVIRAYGPQEQSWLIDWGIFRGDTTQPEVWAAFDEMRRTRRWVHESGAEMAIRATCVDSGDDPTPVYAYTKPRLSDYVFAIKGASDPTADILPKKFTRTALKSRMYLIGTQNIKRRLFSRVGRIAPEPYTLDGGGPGFMHFNARADASYFAEFFSQKVVRKKYRDKSVMVYEKRADARDEKLDCEGYAYVALLLGPVSVPSLHQEWERVMADGEKATALALSPGQHDAPTPTPAAAAPVATSWLPRRSGSWLGR